MSDPTTNKPIQTGDYVLSLIWPDHVGTVTAVDDGDLNISWHGTFTNDEARPDQVRRLTDEEKAAYTAAQPPGYDDGFVRMHLPEVES